MTGYWRGCGKCLLQSVKIALRNPQDASQRPTAYFTCTFGMPWLRYRYLQTGYQSLKPFNGWNCLWRGGSQEFLEEDVATKAKQRTVLDSRDRRVSTVGNLLLDADAKKRLPEKGCLVWKGITHRVRSYIDLACQQESNTRLVIVYAFQQVVNRSYYTGERNRNGQHM